MPCNPNDVSIPMPDGPSGPAIPGFGIPFSLPIKPISPYPDGFPEDLLDILNKLQFIIPPGTLKPALNPNFGKDIFDGIMKLLDQFMPFLMLYKFFLPVLNLIICIIEVLCAIPNPYKLVRALSRLFRNCLPPFLNLFPMFALIVMIISLILLLIALAEYILDQILKLIKVILRNILALNKATQENNAESVLAIAKKLGSILCLFQNLFVLLSLFSIIVQIVRDILKLSFSIPPCDSNSSDADGCCTPDVCPAIVKQSYTRFTGTLQYFNSVKQATTFGTAFNVSLRNESWQIFDPSQTIAQKFINIVDAYDITYTPKPVFFPTDSNYNISTPIKQAPYLVDMRVLYNPSQWNGRVGTPRWIRFKNCIVTAAPNTYYTDYHNAAIGVSSGVLNIVGGLGYEDNGTTPLTGFASDGITPISSQATINNFLHFPEIISLTPVLNPTDGYQFYNDVEYTFKPSIEVLINKNLVTLGCHPDLALNKAFINEVFAGDAALKFSLLDGIMNSSNFPDPDKALECLTTAVASLRNDLTVSGLATFQVTTTACLAKLISDANKSLIDMIALGFDPCSSILSGSPKVQFTGQPIKIKIDLKDRNKINLTTGLSDSTATQVAARLKAYPSFGTMSPFKYDGYQYFTADLNSTTAGSGSLTVSFDNNLFCTNNIPSDVTIAPSHVLQTFDYKFIYTLDGVPVTKYGTGDESDGPSPRRDERDLGGSE